MNSKQNGNGSDQELMAGVRLVVLNLPEDEGEGIGFRLTRTLWDPYPWVHEVIPSSRADSAGLRTGDCLLQADGKDLLGLPVSQVAGLIRGDGAGRGVSLLVWSCGVDPRDDPELLWSCGGGARGERARRALSGAVRALACCVCAATATKPLTCARSHLYCEACWTRLERCALCRETLPAKDSPYAKNLVAEQVFEAIATEYEIKETLKRPTESVSAYTSPNRSPNASPAIQRKGQYKLSMMHKKAVQFNEKFSPNYVSDPNIHSSLHVQEFAKRFPNPTKIVAESTNGNTCSCQNLKLDIRNDVPVIKIEDTECGDRKNGSYCNGIQHKLVARLRQACSLADLQNASPQCCLASQSLNNINLAENNNVKEHHTGSLDNCSSLCGSPPVFVLSSPPIYLLACDHDKN